MSRKSNIIKGWVTSIIGVGILLMTFLMLFIGEIKFLWEGIAGICAGVILLYTPRSIEKFIDKWVSGGSNTNNPNVGG